jgi:AcrR family transcriptional regulator
MMPGDQPSAPQQERSRETLQRLLKATIDTLERHGLEGATIPRIAAKAGVVPASIYRRFKDKDALYRAAFLKLLEPSLEASRQNLRPELFARLSFEKAIEQIVAAIIRQYREHPGVLRALSRFGDRPAEKKFARRILKLIHTNFSNIAAVLLRYQSRIKHPDPLLAVSFALLSAVTVIEIQARKGYSLWNVALSLSDQQLKAEMTRMVLAFLRSK